VAQGHGHPTGDFKVAFGHEHPLVGKIWRQSWHPQCRMKKNPPLLPTTFINRFERNYGTFKRVGGKNSLSSTLMLGGYHNFMILIGSSFHKVWYLSDMVFSQKNFKISTLGKGINILENIKLVLTMLIFKKLRTTGS